MTNIKIKYLNARLVGILRTKPKTPAKNAITAIQAAFSAGAEAVEITSNSDFWQEILTGCVRDKLNIGVGSIKNQKIAEEAVKLGAKFLVSPGFFEDTIEVANRHNIPILPGVFTEPNFSQAIELGIADTKYFPANVKTHEELYKAISEPFRDEFEELKNKGWELTAFDPANPQSVLPNNVIKSPTQFYKLYLDVLNSKFQPSDSRKIIIKLPEGKSGFERMKEFSEQSLVHGIRTYAVGGVNDKNMKEVLNKYGAYGVCPGSGMFNGEAIFNGDYERVKTDVSRHVAVIRELFTVSGQ